jgi:hypothetical protein
MTAQLVFVHGRSQEHKDADALKQEWIEAWQRGLAKSGLSIPIQEHDIRFPFYGDTLYDLVTGVADPADVIIRGGAPATELAFKQSVIEEIQRAAGISDAQVDEALGAEVRARGPLNWEWVQGILKAIDRHVPGGSGGAIALATNDVYQYLRNPGVRDTIDTGVRAAMDERPTVVVSHSLGTVVAYNLLRRDGAMLHWNVPLLVTVGSPLAVTAIRKGVSPIEYPACVGHWYNAMDERDVVALYPLDDAHFSVTPAIENMREVNNHTTDRHGIDGYLDDPTVARRIYDALVP